MKEILKEIEQKRNKEKGAFLGRFFKTGPGQYGEGDIFWGLTVPESRVIAKKYNNLPRKDIQELLKNKVHEVRLIALLILVSQYKDGDSKEKESIFNFYLKNTKYINNWDLVDTSAHYIVGDFLSDKKDRSVLLKLANSKKLWQERISIVATFAFIRNNDFKYTLELSKLFLTHKHDLIHKACGWMLREVGKRDQRVLEKFLYENSTKMPRTMLRYSIEKFSREARTHYLNR